MTALIKCPDNDTPFWHKHPATKEIKISLSRITAGIADISDFINENLDKPVAYVVSDAYEEAYQIYLYFQTHQDYSKFCLKWINNDEYQYVDEEFETITFGHR